ncbi:MAG: beta-lactamase family protein [Sphingomonadaceae bacterium]|nr:beta-lactamase family protein [Sphingomonadaceae bacterium]
MVKRRLLHILPLLALPSLMACGSNPAPAGPAPPSEASLSAISGETVVDHDDLARTIDSLFDEENVGETRALLVMRGGRIIAARYGEGYDSGTRFLGWSLSKCMTGITIGLLVSDGRLRRDESPPVPAWQRSGDARGEITLRQLLQMRSGLRHEEETDPARMLFLDRRDNMARFAEAQPLESEPGRTFEYSSGTSIILSDIAARALTQSSDPVRRRKAVSKYLRTRLLDPAGMTSFVTEFDAAGTMIGSDMIHANARDWARLGEFLRNGGSVKGVQIIPRRWIEFMLAPSPRNPGYGAQIWLNRPQSDEQIRLFPGKAPESLFGCIGQLGQYVIGSPAQKLTVVRLGHTLDSERPALRSRLGDLIALFPARQR